MLIDQIKVIQSKFDQIKVTQSQLEAFEEVKVTQCISFPSLQSFPGLQSTMIIFAFHTQ